VGNGNMVIWTCTGIWNISDDFLTVRWWNIFIFLSFQSTQWQLLTLPEMGCKAEL
jgi:hypothetical protein